ncbi:MAG: phytanoyl-CoA dioxygenase family protein [Dehalococcoidia bacterium]
MVLAQRATAAEQKAQYQETGYLVYPELLDATELQALRTALAEVLVEAEGLTESTGKFLLAKDDSGAGHVVRRITGPVEHHKAFYDLVFNPKIVDIIENLIGPDIQLHHTKLNLKPRSRQARFEWHQDYPFFPHTNFDLVAVMVYFDDSTEENGCLTIVPGSHKLGPRNHLFASDGAFSSQLEDRSVLEDRGSWQSVPAPAGGISVHHCNMLHSSLANTTDKPRSAMVIQYRAADNVQVGGHTGHFGWGLQIRGANPHRVRMIEGAFGLPGVITNPLQRDG